ncbi:hypothetical protein KZZ52_34920 [Dactylosporangium sp. AC04546]|uniref:hypothetical protein n=1 Tax=Dactylosporangium sp. AC04546 TaxID=2862460 RepID=UPI001EDF3FCA|nr:hypothetical protein [Dactylosporangium sp. AC04546]WVK79163.1 hypothetical protein KZZ52_34920 [Dactylosporangium sp. AC04546]
MSGGVHNGQLVWSVETSCGGCGAEAIECGWNDMPEAVRAELLAQDGPARLRLDPVAARPLRVRLLAALRRSGGGSLAEVARLFERLTGDGITGTEAEMRLLAGRLAAEGARVDLQPPPPGLDRGGARPAPPPTDASPAD